MKRHSKALLIIPGLLMLIGLSSVLGIAEAAEGKGPHRLVTEHYRVIDLPIYTATGNADFHILMQLIQAKVEPKSWESAGGPSTMAPYRGNGSLVVHNKSFFHL